MTISIPSASIAQISDVAANMALLDNLGISWLRQAAIVDRQGFWFYNSLAPSGAISSPTHLAPIDVECSVNHFHFLAEDIVSGISAVIMVFALTHRMHEKSLLGGSIRQIAVVQTGDDANRSRDAQVTVRFHRVRDNDEWLSSSSESGRDCILLCE